MTGLQPSLMSQAPLEQARRRTDVLPKPETVLVDPFSLSSRFKDHGISFVLGNVNEMSGMINGPTPGLGLSKGASNTGQYSMESVIDWGRVAGFAGLSTHAVIVGRYGIPVSSMFGDTLLTPSQEIYGSGGNVFVHLVYAYAEETLFKDRLNIAAGRMSFLSDFSANPFYCNFMNNSFCGNPKAAGDNTAHASYPDANWALRFRIRLSATTIFQFGVYFTETRSIYTNTQMRTGFKFNGANIDGEAMPVEFTWAPRWGREHTLSGHYKFGFAYATADHRDNYYDGNGNAFALTRLPARKVHGAWAAWALLDQMVYHHPKGTADAGISLLGVAYFNKPQTQTRSAQYSFGIFDRGFWKSRPSDAIGVDFAYSQISDDLTRSERLFALQSLPIPNGALFPQTSTYNLEAIYQVHVMRGIIFSPDFQYYIHPGGQKQLRNQALIGFKSHIALF